MDIIIIQIKCFGNINYNGMNTSILIFHLQEVSANLIGEMRLRIETEHVTVSTHFKDLEVAELGKIISD